MFLYLAKKILIGHEWVRTRNSLNIWCIKIHTKDSSKTLLSLVRILMHQTLGMGLFYVIYESIFIFKHQCTFYARKNKFLKSYLIAMIGNPNLYNIAFTKTSLCFIDILFPKLFWPTVRKNWICKIFEITKIWIL